MYCRSTTITSTLLEYLSSLWKILSLQVHLMCPCGWGCPTLVRAGIVFTSWKDVDVPHVIAFASAMADSICPAITRAFCSVSSGSKSNRSRTWAVRVFSTSRSRIISSERSLNSPLTAISRKAATNWAVDSPGLHACWQNLYHSKTTFTFDMKKAVNTPTAAEYVSPSTGRV